MYIGYHLWQKAEKLEEVMKKIFPHYFSNIDTSGTREQFSTSSPEKKINFDIKYQNYTEAIALMKTIPTIDVNQNYLLAKLHYYKGEEEEGKKIINGILEMNSSNCESLNKTGYFYLSNLLRVKEALAYFEKSLNLNQAQPEIVYVANKLKNDYLNKLTEVWK
jgi:tetratricopeptide (TPR) repeat protein